jgi:glutaredoxin
MITLYSKPNCVYCDKAKVWLAKYGFPFEAIDISVDEEARQFVVNQGHKSVPQVYVNDTILIEGGYTGLSKYEPTQLKEIIQNATAKVI